MKGTDAEVPSERERKLYAILGEFFDLAVGSREPDPAEWLARYPEFAAELEAFFKEQDEMHRDAEPLRLLAQSVPKLPIDLVAVGQTAGQQTESVGPTPSRNGASRKGSARSEPEPDGRFFGGYELLGEIARGGMGVVYRARQPGLDRQVALKLLLSGAPTSPGDVQRFRNEAQAAADLDHPNIVPIYEVGEHRGLPYFTMKLIEGGTLTDRAAEHASDPREAARLMAIVARAVHHAHLRGVLHRDLKPSNILLDERGCPYVTDFGLARRVEGHPELTQSGAILGSPPYMAPEQTYGRKGTVTTATDIYGLGTVLYTLLSGRPPFRGDSALETLEGVRHRMPEPLGRGGGRVDRDLETICMRCLAKEPEGRYPTAEAVAEDLERWLAGEPIRARPIGRSRRAWRWCRRNPLLAGLSASVALLMAAGLVGLMVSNRSIARKNIEIERSRDEAVEARRRADRERDEARVQRERARRAVDEMYTQVADTWLKDQPRMEPLQREFLEKALNFYQGFSQERGSDSAVQFETAQAYQRVGDLQRNLGRCSQAEAAYLQAIELLEALEHDQPDVPEYRLALSYCQMTLGFLLEPDRTSLAEKAHRRAVELSEALAKRFPGDPRYRQAVAQRLNNLGNPVMRLGRYLEAESLYRRSLVLSEQLNRDYPSEPRNKYTIAVAQFSIADVLDSAGRAGPAASAYRRCLVICDNLAREHPSKAIYQHMQSDASACYGSLLVAMGRIPEAEAALNVAQTVATKLIEGHPDVPDYREDLKRYYIGRGRIEAVLGRSREAESCFLKALSIREQLDAQDATRMGGGGRDAALIRRTLGDLLRSSGDSEGASSYYRRSLKALEGLAETQSDSPLDWHNLAWFLATCPDARFRDPGRAISWAERAVKHSPDGRFWTTLGVARYRDGDCRRAIADLERQMAVNDGGTATDWLFLAMAHHRLGDERQAHNWLDKAVAWTAVNKPKDVVLAMFRGEAEALIAGDGPRP